MKELEKRFKKLLQLEIRARDTYFQILKDAQLANEDGEIDKILRLIKGQEEEHIFAAKRLIALNNQANKRKTKPKISKTALASLRADFIFRRTLINTATALLGLELRTFVELNTLGEKSRAFQKSFKERDELMAEVTHQLKTPPTVSNWIVDILMKERTGKLTDEQKKMIEQIKTSNSSMISFINDLIDIYRTETKSELKIETIDLISLSEEEIKKLIPLAENIGKNFNFQAPNDNILIQSDKNAIQKIISNLLLNALHYGAKEDKIRVAVDKKADGIIFSVSDHGIGIPPKEQSEIFKRFFRASNAKKKHPAGSGLGLYIVKELVEKIGGKIWFESTENKGTTFYLAL